MNQSFVLKLLQFRLMKLDEFCGRFFGSFRNEGLVIFQSFIHKHYYIRKSGQIRRLENPLE